MQKNRSFLLITFFLFISTNFICMEREIISKLTERKIIPELQKTMTIPCIDGEYKLPVCQAPESITLFKHCLQYNKNFEKIADTSTIKIPKIPMEYESIKLFSEALDKAHDREIFKEYFNGLKGERQRKLWIISGEYDEKGNRQFNSPTLIASIVDTCFNYEWRSKHIKPLLQRSLWLEYCMSKVAAHNLTYPILPDITFLKKQEDIMIHDNGQLSLVPSYLSAKDSLYDGPYAVVKKDIQGFDWKMLRCKKIDNDWEHCITTPNADGFGESANEIMIWAINNKNKTIAKTIVKHKEDIWQYFFSKNGEYVITRSEKDVFVSKIIHKEDGSCAFDTRCIHHANKCIMEICFDNQSHNMIVCSVDENYESVIKLLDISGLCIAQVPAQNLGLVNKVLFSPDGQRLLILSIIDKKTIISLYTVKNDIHRDSIFAISDENFSKIDHVICSPNGWYWAITTDSGGILFIPTCGSMCKGAVCLVEESFVTPNKRMNILFSSDSRFLIALVEEKLDELRIKVWSTYNGEKVASIISFTGRDSRHGIGLTPYDRELLTFVEDQVVYKRPFIDQESEKILTGLWDLTVYGLTVLRRLYLAHKNKESIELYEEEPAYKVLINLKKEPLNVAAFVAKYLPYKTINNKKEVKQFLQEMWKNITF